MFALDLWDSPLMLMGEIALSIAVVAVIMFAARMANSRSAAQPNRGSVPSAKAPRSAAEDNVPDAEEAERDDPEAPKPRA